MTISASNVKVINSSIPDTATTLLNYGPIYIFIFDQGRYAILTFTSWYT